MPDSVSLIKANPLLPSEDYSLLRKQGLNEIEHLGSDTWTNYNYSDPGITILEAVCYAITDLGYRTEFEIKDLLAPEQLSDDTWKQIFYTARQILHNNPLTLNDWRKLIIDVKGVRNAWIEPSKDYEVPVWINYNYSELRKDYDCSCTDAEEKTCWGKLSVLPESQTGSSQSDEWRKTIERDKKNLAALDAQEQQWNAELANERDPAKQEILKKELNELVQRKVPITQEMQKIQALLDSLDTNLIPPKIVELEGLYNVMVEYEEDVLEDEREAVRQQIVDRLSRYRNLCEDFLSVDAVAYEDFGIGASIVLEEYADPDVVLSQIFFVIYKYFTPSIPFHTIDQMMDKGYLVDEIFEGPALKHGFVDDVELEKTDLFRDIRLSDIISEVADIPGIRAITYLHLPFPSVTDSDKYYFNQWVDSLREERKIARIQPSMSKLMFCKERDFITYYVGRPQDRRPDRMLKLFNDLKIVERKYKLEGQQIDFPVPAGEYMDLEDYYPISYSLPMCYGISPYAGIPVDATEKRKAQAKQLRGYLLFFEQILADHLVQLNHLRDLFSFDDRISHTYFTRALTELDGLNELIIDHQNRGANHFDQVLKDFTHVLQNLAEPTKVFWKRRNIFLNHMLARFSEDLSEYESISRWLTPYNVEERLIHDKIRILKNGEYYRISSQRSKAYDYSRPDFLDSNNVSGAERRVERLLGFENIQRRNLSPEWIVIEPIMDTDPKTRQPVRRMDKNGNPLSMIRFMDPDSKDTVLLTSVDVKEGCCAELLLNEILVYADERKYYHFHDEQKLRSRKSAGDVGSYWFELWDDTDPDTAVLLATSGHFEKREAREQVYKKLQNLWEIINNNEGMHLVEHILLRPKFDEVLDEAGNELEVKFLNICLDPCDLNKGLDEGTELPPYRKKIHRIPASKCFDQMPWVLEYFRFNTSTNEFDQSILFQETFADGKSPVPLKFRHYDLLAQRVKDLQEFGSEYINYAIISNEETDPLKLKYSFLIMGGKGKVLAQSPFMFNKRTQKQIEDGVMVSDDIELEILRLMRYFGFDLDLYCEEDPCDNNEDPYSFRITVVLPCWPKRLRDTTFRNLVEKTIQTEFPAHLHTRIVWVGLLEMQRFEKLYYEWLREMALTEMPGYEKVNPLVDVLNTLRPCGICDEDCA
ncbi:MAG: hypothetical protein ACJ75B_07915 [Flavisolibacter sp.]